MSHGRRLRFRRPWDSSQWQVGHRWVRAEGAGNGALRRSESSTWRHLTSRRLSDRGEDQVMSRVRVGMLGITLSLAVCSSTGRAEAGPTDLIGASFSISSGPTYRATIGPPFFA